MYHAMSKDMMPRMQYNLSTIGKAVRWLEFLPSYNHQPTLSTKAASEGNQPPPPLEGPPEVSAEDPAEGGAGGKTFVIWLHFPRKNV